MRVSDSIVTELYLSMVIQSSDLIASCSFTCAIDITT